MPSVTIRKPFAGMRRPTATRHVLCDMYANYTTAAFAFLLLAAAYLGLSTQKIPQYGQSDKGLHFITFFLLTVTFWWILETSRRRVLHLTLLVCTAGLSVVSEVVQALLPNDRAFDPFDILANVVGSALGLALCNWYHKRMLDRKRKNKRYSAVPGDDVEDGDPVEGDVELGEGVGSEEHAVSEQETGVVGSASYDESAQASVGAEHPATNITEELDNWDENAEDWDEEPFAAKDPKTATADVDDSLDTKRRTE